MLVKSFNRSEPPWYGPVCLVVWEGWCREAPLYPDCRHIAELGNKNAIGGRVVAVTRAMYLCEASSLRTSNDTGVTLPVSAPVFK